MKPKVLYPNATPLQGKKHALGSSDIDLDCLAHHFEIAGANIRNIALAAGYLPAADGGVIKMIHLIRAIRREYQKMGKILIEEDFGKYAGLR